MENWKDISNTHYQVSNIGRVRNSINNNIIKQQINTRGYCIIRINDNNHHKITKTVHRLVAQAFCENPRKLVEINHQDGNKLNNNANNLAWCTRGENIKHAWDNGLRHFTNKSRQAVLENIKQAQTPEVIARRRYPRSRKTRCVETGKVFKSMKEAADYVGSHEQNIQECCASNGRRTSKGFHWEYVNS